MKMKFEAEAEIRQIIEMKNNETGEITYLVEQDGEWLPISQQEYYIILGRDIDGKQ